MICALTPGVSPDILGDSVRDEVAKALGDVPRHMFLPEHKRMTAYMDRAVSLGSGRRCPQPSVVARMLNACQGLDGRVLVVAAGTGYVAACAAETASEVVAVETNQDLVSRAAIALGHVRGGQRIVLRESLPPLAALEAAPFDAILICAALERSPRRLLGALTEGGVLVAPITNERTKLYAFQHIARGHLRRDLGLIDVEPLPAVDPSEC